MPLYEFECPTCRELHTRLLPSSERDTPQVCQTVHDTLKVNGATVKTSRSVICQSRLVRVEVARTARTPAAWRP